MIEIVCRGEISPRSSVMPTLESTSIKEKALELCQFVADAPEFTKAHETIKSFLEDDEAKGLYQKWREKGMELHQMGHQGKEPTDADLDEINAAQKAVQANPLAAAFVNAEGQLDDTFQTVTKLLQKTLQLGRVPTEEDLVESDCCSSGGCGCG